MLLAISISAVVASYLLIGFLLQRHAGGISCSGSTAHDPRWGPEHEETTYHAIGVVRTKILLLLFWPLFFGLGIASDRFPAAERALTKVFFGD